MLNKFTKIGLVITFAVVISVVCFLGISNARGELAEWKSAMESVDQETSQEKDEGSRAVDDELIYESNPTGSNWDLYRRVIATGVETNITNDPDQDMNPQLSPDRSTLVFVSNRDGDYDIWSMDLSDYSVTNLTDNDNTEWDPDWSPDGTKVVYKSDYDDGKGDIWVMDSDGSNQTNLTPERSDVEDWDPTYTRQGTQIVFVTRMGANAATDEIFIMDSDGDNVTRLTTNRVPDWYPDCHPSQDLILFTSKVSPCSPTGDDIYTMNYAGGSRSLLYQSPGDNDDQMYNSDGTEIVFCNNNSGYYRLWTMDSDGTNDAQLSSQSYNILAPIYY